MDLVTVTCIRDINAMIKQAESIQKFVKPCTHWVILNDEHVDKELWNNVLTPFYTNHNLKLVVPKWKQWDFNFLTRLFHVPYHPMGYKIQQVHKLLISEKLTDDYLITDSENIFIKPTDINDWRDTIGSGTTIEFSKLGSYKETIPHYAKKIGCDIPNLLLEPTTPFVINLEVMKSVEKLRPLLKWFHKLNKVPQSEFFLYSLLAYKHGLFDGCTPKTSSRSRIFLKGEEHTLEDTCSWIVVRYRSR